jgi:hypothetical protein
MLDDSYLEIKKINKKSHNKLLILKYSMFILVNLLDINGVLFVVKIHFPCSKTFNFLLNCFLYLIYKVSYELY